MNMDCCFYRIFSTSLESNATELCININFYAVAVYKIKCNKLKLAINENNSR